MSDKKKRWSFECDGDPRHDPIDIRDARHPNVLFAAPFLTTLRQARAVVAALNALEAP